MDKIIIRLMGGLGNQLFQYAFGKQISTKKNMELLLDTSSYLRKGSRTYDLKSYAISGRELNPIELLWYVPKYYANLKLAIGEKNMIHEKELFLYEDVTVNPNNYYIGFWQNEKYFENVRDELMNDLILKKPYDIKMQKIIEEISASESVAVHVRRGDYLKKGFSDIYAVQDMCYYQRAKDFLYAKKADLKFYIFSDDIEWCKQNFSWGKGISFVDENVTNDPILQFEIMRNCKHFIIANSTYSWWAAWLGVNKEGIRLAPGRWYIDERVNADCKRALLNGFIQI